MPRRTQEGKASQRSTSFRECVSVGCDGRHVEIAAQLWNSVQFRNVEIGFDAERIICQLRQRKVTRMDVEHERAEVLEAVRNLAFLIRALVLRGPPPVS